MARIIEPEHQWIHPNAPETWDCAHADKEPGHTTLYVIHSMLNDDTLYVGITGSVKRRFTQHRRKKKWWSESELANLECYDSWESACEAEFDRIKKWKPVHNIIGNEMRRRLEAERERRTLCSVCEFPTEPDPEDSPDSGPLQHPQCNDAVCEAYEMGRASTLPEGHPWRIQVYARYDASSRARQARQVQG